MRIVEVARVRVSAVDEGRACSVETITREQDSAAARTTHFQLQPTHRPAPRQLSTHGNDPQQIEHQRFHPVDHRGQRILEPETRGPFGQHGRRSLIVASSHEIETPFAKLQVAIIGTTSDHSPEDAALFRPAR